MRKRTAEFIEEHRAASAGRRKGKPRGRPFQKGNKMNPRPWPKGVSGNPSGKPGFDVPAYLARKAFEQNQEAVYRGMAKRLMAGEPYAFKEYADRGYGKLKETRSMELSGKITLEQALEAERRAERELK